MDAPDQIISTNPFVAAQQRRIQAAQAFHVQIAARATGQADQNLNVLQARVRRLEAMLEGATIACNESGGITLTWGA